MSNDERNNIEEEKVFDNLVCSCWPEHCDNLDEHGPCWCCPTIEEYGNGILVVHNEAN